MSQKKRSVVLCLMSIAVMIMLKIPKNPYSMLIGILILILVLGILTQVYFLIFRSFKLLTRNASEEPGAQRRRRRWVAFLVCGVVFCGAFEVALDRYSRSLPIFQEAINLLNVSEVAKTEIGEPIEMGWPITASLDWSSESENVELAIPVSGSRGKGTVHVTGRKMVGRWRIEGLYLIMRGNSERRLNLAGGSSLSGAGDSPKSNGPQKRAASKTLEPKAGLEPATC